MFKKLLYCPSLLLLACSKGVPTPAVPEATASFTVSRNLVDLGEQVQATNTSQHATRYEWRIFDNNALFGTTTDWSFSNRLPADYTVTLTAYNQDGRAATASQLIQVDTRYFARFQVNTIDFVRPDGQPWRSDGSNPELHISLISPTGVSLYMDQQNMQPSFLPLLWVATPNALRVGPGQWRVRFEDRMPNGQLILMHEAALLVAGPPLTAMPLAMGRTAIRLATGPSCLKLIYSARAS